MMFHAKRVLITGAGGFIGSHLTKCMLRENAEVHAMVSPAYRARDMTGPVQNPTIWRGDLRDEDFLRECLRASRPHVLYHLADYGTRAGQTDIAQMVSVNVSAWSRLLGLLQNEEDLECIVNAGSSAEYGPSRTPMREDQVLRPCTAYGAVKASAGILMRALAAERGVRAVTLRMFYVYGPGESRERLLPAAYEACMQERILPVTALSEKRDFVFVEDAVEAMRLAYTSGTGVNPDSQIINVGGGKESSILDIARALHSLTGKTLRVKEGAYPPRPWNSPCWAADIAKAREALGWAPRHDLMNGLQKTIQSMQGGVLY